jgi:hypothetical protein
VLEETQRFLPVVVVEPGRVAELDAHLVACELFLRPLEVLERAILEDDVRGQLEQDPAQLPGAAQRLERLVEAPEDLGSKLARRPVDAALLVHRRLVAQVRRQLLRLDRVSRHDAERLHVHHEAIGRPLRPARDHLFDGEAVVRRVDLDRVEVRRVPAQPLARLHRGRVPVLREGLVRPGAGADTDRRAHGTDARGGRDLSGPALLEACFAT